MTITMIAPEGWYAAMHHTKFAIDCGMIGLGAPVVELTAEAVLYDQVQTARYLHEHATSCMACHYSDDCPEHDLPF